MEQNSATSSYGSWIGRTIRLELKNTSSQQFFWRTPSVVSDLAYKINVFATMAQNVHRYDDELELEAAFNWRDAIQVDLESGAELSPDQEKMLIEADLSILRIAPELVERFPETYHPGRKPLTPTWWWWWHLDDEKAVHTYAPRNDVTASR